MREPRFLRQERRPQEPIGERLQREFIANLRRAPGNTHVERGGRINVANEERIVLEFRREEYEKPNEKTTVSQEVQLAQDVLQAFDSTKPLIGPKAEPAVIQIAKLVARLGEPTVIHYARRWWDPDSQKLMRTETSFSFESVREEILKTARALDSERYANMSLEEIGKDLLEQEQKERKERVRRRLIEKLEQPPQQERVDHPVVGVILTDAISVTWVDEISIGDETLLRESRKEWLRPGTRNKDGKLEGEPIAYQLAKLFAQHGKPHVINYRRQEQIFLVEEGVYPRNMLEGDDVEWDDDLESAVKRACERLNPEFANKSLAEIGEALQTEEK